MSEFLNIACIQNCVGLNVSKNLLELEEIIYTANRDGAEFVCIPEYGTCLDMQGSDFLVGAAPLDNHAALIFMTNLAKEIGIWILIGSRPSR